MTLTYVIMVRQGIKVGIGGALLDKEVNDHADGIGDVDGYQLQAGDQRVTRTFDVPSDLAPGWYEIEAEIWPSGEIDVAGVDVLGEATCATFDVS